MPDNAIPDFRRALGTRLCQMLDGINVAPRYNAEARKLIGHRIEYLRESDIDRSGRGYFFPKRGTVTGAYGRWLEIDAGDNWQPIRSFVEVVDLGPAPESAE